MSDSLSPQAPEELRQAATGMDLHVEVPFSMAAHAAAPSRLSALVLPPPPPPPPPPGTAASAVAAAAAAAAATAARQALPVGELCLLTAAVRVTAPCEVRVSLTHFCSTLAWAMGSFRNDAMICCWV